MPAALDEAGLAALFDGSGRRFPAAASPRRTGSPTTRAALSTEDDSALKALFGATRAATYAWPGYNVLAVPVLLVRPNGRALLIGHPNPPAGFSPADFEGRAVWAADGQPLPEFFFGDSRINGVNTFSFVLGASGASLESEAGLLAHERFHQYQEKVWGEPGAPAPYELEDPADIAAAGAEQDALARALDDPARSKEALEEFLAVRRWRTTRHPEIADHENWLERLEGTARYVEFSALADAASASGFLAKALRKAPSLESMGRTRYYTTGAALCLMLDRLDPSWKAEAAAGSAPAEILARRFHVPEAALDGMARHALAGPAYAGILAEASADISRLAKAREEALSRFRAQPGLLLVFATSASNSRSYRVMYHLPAGGGDLFDPADQLNIDDHGWSLRIRGRAVLLDVQDRPNFVVDPQAVMVDGSPYDLQTGRRTFGTLSVSQQGIAFSAAEGVLEYDGKVLLVRRRQGR